MDSKFKLLSYDKVRSLYFFLKLNMRLDRVAHIIGRVGFTCDQAAHGLTGMFQKLFSQKSTIGFPVEDQK